MHRTVALIVVGLTGDLLGDATPNLQALAREGCARPLEPVLPAVTCSVCFNCVRKRSTCSAHIRSATPTFAIPPGNRLAASANGSSVSSHGTNSMPSEPAGDSWAAGNSSLGTTMNGSPAAGTTRQVSRSSGNAS